MIQADLIPAAEIKQLEANLASRTGSRLRAEQALFEARQELGLAMGLRAEELGSIAPPSDDFPEVQGAVPKIGQEDLFLDGARDRRADLLAAKTRIDAADRLLDAARSGVKPRLDFQLQAGYKGLNEGDSFSSFFGPLSDKVGGMNLGAALVFQFPPKNRAALGQLAHSEAVSQQARISTQDRDRQIRSGLAVAISSLSRAVDRVSIAHRTVELFLAAVEDERQKLRLGSGTVIDLIVTQDNLTQAQVDEVQARLAYASAVARLRYETGTLVPEGDSPESIDRTLLTTPPPAGR
jgi:outer membrane protein TolC